MFRPRYHVPLFQIEVYKITVLLKVSRTCFIKKLTKARGYVKGNAIDSNQLVFPHYDFFIIFAKKVIKIKADNSKL